jgi:3-dehydrosphinganine reductase
MSVQDHFRNQHCLITGGSSGIGLALARQLADAGANVTILARRPDLLQTALQEIETHRCTPEQIFNSLQADVSNATTLVPILEQHVAQYGSPNFLFNSAGISHPACFEETSLEIFEQLNAVNYLGTVYVTRTLIPGMLQRGSGHIINLSSVAGFIGTYGYSAYSATKFAVRGFSDTLRAELKPRRIRVSVVFPPDTDTPQLAYETPLKPPVTRELAKNAGLLSADTVARSILRGVARNRYIITPGSEATLFYALVHTLGNAVYWIMDRMVADALRKTRTS